MNYELINGVSPQSPAWPTFKQWAKEENAPFIVLQPLPGLLGVAKEQDIQLRSVIDFVTKRRYAKDSYRFFNEAPVPDGAEIFMSGDGVISIIYEGEIIGYVTTYANTRRAVKQIDYLNPDQTKDFTEEYAYDGNQYSNLFYYDNTLQQIQFLNNDGQIVVREYLYDGMINMITIEDPITGKVVTQYDDLTRFLTATVAKMVTAHDTVRIHYMGVELNVLKDSPAHNVLRLAEAPFDDQGTVRGFLLMILKDEINYVQEVEVSRAAYQALTVQNIPLEKATIIDDPLSDPK
ncbi:hypothetical protein LH991_00870 [Schleiferilactobacillus harbinensis]|uniref:Uncharacterized protein n=1 Tax=Schleiferilactobacillus harbinensis DSM 16991 TaxID=1122147 RepID=A0A0R1XG18_9LACO|nr:hypothetical protein [Schleiferilactobacillus harbinensis]KRM29032.1 hypothetical protein FC91_GL001196 [Schleiferilactobacillus harbinensis DSM 16991]QFR62641.1 hypothetical protein LH991_00870 [Schleiferilactobacillus harbinensis]